MADLQQAVDAMAEVFGDGMFAMQVGGSFTCSEAEVIADVLTAGGHPEDAERWLGGHSLGDDEGDIHHVEEVTEDADTGPEGTRPT